MSGRVWTCRWEGPNAKAASATIAELFALSGGTARSVHVFCGHGRAPWRVEVREVQESEGVLVAVLWPLSPHQLDPRQPVLELPVPDMTTS